MARLCIHNARLVTAAEEKPGGVVVGDDGRIEAMLAGTAKAAAETVYDARGRLLFAGFIDAHVHMRDPGFTHKEEFGTGTTAAAIGGVTTVMCMPNTNPPIDGPAGFAAARAAGEKAALVDFTLQGAIVPGNLDRLEELWATGITSFEALMADVPDPVRLDDDQMLAALQTVAGLDAIVGVLPGAHAIYAAEVARVRASGTTEYLAAARARRPVAEAAGLAAFLELARATTARVALRQTSTVRGFALVAAAKAELKGRLTVELIPHYMALDESALTRHGPFAWMIPPLKTPADGAAAARALADGTIDFIGTDHAPHARAEKEGKSPWDAMPGTPGLDTVAAVILNQACTGAIPFTRVAQVLGEGPARTFGVASRKGRLAVGADGDLAVVDPKLAKTVTAVMIHSKAGRSPFEGERLVGWPVLTALRGRVVAEDGRIVDATPGGRFVGRDAA